MELAEALSVEDCEITPEEILEVVEGRVIACEEVGAINIWLST